MIEPSGCKPFCFEVGPIHVYAQLQVDAIK